MKIKSIQDTSNVQSWEELRRFVSQNIGAIVSVINGNVDLVDNCNTQLLGVTFTAANSQVSFNHSLGRVPNGYIVASLSANMVLYRGSTPNTASKIYLQSSATGNGKVLVF